MNILIVTQYFFPETFRINEIARELVAEGNQVDVVTGLPNYPEGEIYAGYETKLREDYYGVRIFRTPIRPRHTGSVNLFLNYVSFMFRAKKTVKKLTGPYDIVFCYMPSPIFQLTPAIKAKNRFKCPLVLMCCDQWPESLKARGLDKGIAYNLIGQYCRWSLNKCDHILNVAPSFIEYNHKVNGVPLERMSWSIQHSEDNFKNCDTRKTVSHQTTDLMFAGNIGKVQNVEDIILAYNELKYPDLYIHIFGSGSSGDACKKLVAELGLERNILFYGRVSNAELAGFYSGMDACLLTLSGKTAIGNTIPSKLTGYMSARKMIIAAINGDSRQVIDQAKCGIYTDADDYKKLAQLIDNYYQNKEQYASCGDNARTYFERYCSLEPFMELLNTIFMNSIREGIKQ